MTMRATCICLFRNAAIRQNAQCMAGRPKVKKETRGHTLTKTKPPATDNKELVRAAQTFRSIIQQYHEDGKDEILLNFHEQHPDESKIIRRHGGVKSVSQLLPHMYGWGSGGQLTAPPDGMDRDDLQQMAKNTRVIMLEDAFLMDGGSMANMNQFEREQCDEKGNYIPHAVAIDVEGHHLVPPILIQVCPIHDSGLDETNEKNQRNNSKVYLEQPKQQTSSAGKPQLSDALKDLLASKSVLKVFFGQGQDKISLRVPVNNTLCLQKEISKSRETHRKSSSSLADAINEYSMAKDGVHCGIRYVCQKNRRLQKSFGFQKRPEQRLQEKYLLYGAADAWATAKIYQSMKTF